jgi:uncharacterized protein involved in outer membrane biogenesis
MTSPAPTRKRPIDLAADHPWWTILAVLALVALVLWLLWDWNWFKGPVERQVETRTGRTFDIGGDLDVDLGRITTIRADRLRLGNAAWSKEPTMATAEQLELRIEPLALLLRRPTRMFDLHLRKPVLRLETGSGRGNWVFRQGGGDPPDVRRLWVDDGDLRFIDAAQDTDLRLALASQTARKGDAAPPIALEGGGSWRGNRLDLKGQAESPLELQHTEQPYRIDLHATSGRTRAHARGNLVNPFRFEDFDLQLALSGQNLADLYPLIGVATPDTPPYALDGRFTRKIGRGRVTWHYDGFSGKIGDTDLAGSTSITTGGPRPFLHAELRSKRLDFDDLAGFAGGAPKSGAGETTNPELRARAARLAASGRVLPDTPYELDKLRAMDADVRWKATSIDSTGLPLDDMDAHLKLDDGVLVLDPLDFGVAGGKLRSNLRMNAREATIQTRAKITARGMELGKLLPDAKLAQGVAGRVGGDITLAGRGNSVARMLASADGDVALGMGRGQVSNLLMEYAGLDIYEALKFLIMGDQLIPIRCAFGDFTVKGGVMTSRALAFDTTDTIIVGEGTIDLRDETLDLLLRPRPKDRSPLSLRAPLVATGTFKNPSIRPDFARVGLRGALALALGSIAPPAALLATLELGPGEDANCGGRYAK